MSTKSLPAYLQQALQKHVEQSDLTHDDELEGIYARLTHLNDSVEKIKHKIIQQRQARNINK